MNVVASILYDEADVGGRQSCRDSLLLDSIPTDSARCLFVAASVLPSRVRSAVYHIDKHELPQTATYCRCTIMFVRITPLLDEFSFPA